MKKWYNLFVIGIVLPVIVHYVVYYRFTPNYLPNVFSEQGFTLMYDQSVFKYRVLGIKTQMWLYQLLSSFPQKAIFYEHSVYSKRLFSLDAQADPIFYAAYFINNTFFAVLFNLLLVRSLENRRLFSLKAAEKIIIVVVLSLLIALTQFAVTPYDNMSYFFILAAITLFYAQLESPAGWKQMLLWVLIFLATLARESSLMILCVMATVYYFRHQKAWIPTLISMLPAIVAYLLAYIGVRWIVSEGHEITQHLTIWENLLSMRKTVFFSIGFAAIIFYSINQFAIEKQHQDVWKTYWVMTIPYLTFILFFGLLVEFRLWIPFIIGAISLLCLRRPFIDQKPGKA